MSEDVRETNRAHWDALAAVHGQDDYYDAEALVGGADTLSRHENAAVGGGRRARRPAPAVPHRLRRDLAGAPRRARDRRGLLPGVAGEGARPRRAGRGGGGVRRGRRDGAAAGAARALRPRLRDDGRDLLDRGSGGLDALGPHGAAAGRAARAGGDPPALQHGRGAGAAAAGLPLRRRRPAPLRGSRLLRGPGRRRRRPDRDRVRPLAGGGRLGGGAAPACASTRCTSTSTPTSTRAGACSPERRTGAWGCA